MLHVYAYEEGTNCSLFSISVKDGRPHARMRKLTGAGDELIIPSFILVLCYLLSQDGDTTAKGKTKNISPW